MQNKEAALQTGVTLVTCSRGAACQYVPCGRGGLNVKQFDRQLSHLLLNNVSFQWKYPMRKKLPCSIFSLVLN